MTINRWFVRCLDCLSVAAVIEPPNTHDTLCGLCGGQIEGMGRVEQHRLVRDEIRSACDDRCTSARGPLCDCHCGGKNHGTHRIVRIVRDAGPVPKVAMRSNFAARQVAEEYRAALAAVLGLLDPLLAARRRGVFLASGDFRHLHAMRKVLEHAHKARTHEARMKVLRAVLPSAWRYEEVENPIAELEAGQSLGELLAKAEQLWREKQGGASGPRPADAR